MYFIILKEISEKVRGLWIFFQRPQIKDSDKSMGSKKKKNFFKNKTVLLIIVGIFLFLFGNRKFRSVVKMYIQVNKMNKELVRLKKENESLKNKICLVEKDPSYIEGIARRELGLIKPGEIEYRFIKKKKNK